MTIRDDFKADLKKMKRLVDPRIPLLDMEYIYTLAYHAGENAMDMQWREKTSNVVPFPLPKFGHVDG